MMTQVAKVDCAKHILGRLISVKDDICICFWYYEYLELNYDPLVRFHRNCTMRDFFPELYNLRTQRTTQQHVLMWFKGKAERINAIEMLLTQLEKKYELH